MYSNFHRWDINCHELIVSSLKCLDADDHSIINAFRELIERKIEKHVWPIMVYPNVYCKIKSDSFLKEYNKGIIFNRVLDQKFKVNRMTILCDLM